MYNATGLLANCILHAADEFGLAKRLISASAFVLKLKTADNGEQAFYHKRVLAIKSTSASHSAPHVQALTGRKAALFSNSTCASSPIFGSGTLLMQPGTFQRGSATITFLNHYTTRAGRSVKTSTSAIDDYLNNGPRSASEVKKCVISSEIAEHLHNVFRAQPRLTYLELYLMEIYPIVIIAEERKIQQVQRLLNPAVESFSMKYARSLDKFRSDAIIKCCSKPRQFSDAAALNEDLRQVARSLGIMYNHCLAFPTAFVYFRSNLYEAYRKVQELADVGYLTVNLQFKIAPLKTRNLHNALTNTYPKFIEFASDVDGIVAIYDNVADLALD